VTERDMNAPALETEVWLKPEESAVCAEVVERSSRCLAAYRANPALVEEHANIERSITEGGYGRRQVYELIQNGADALLESGRRGRMHLVLTSDALYCANEGAPITVEGVEAMLGAYVSRKRGSEIGRFGLGFKSVLSVSRNPQFFSRSGSFVFSEATARDEIRLVDPGASVTPVLRTASPVDCSALFSQDPDLAALASWSSTIVKLPREKEMLTDLSDDLHDFPAEFLLFCPHVESVVLEDRDRGESREITLVDHSGGVFVLKDGEGESRWRVFDKLHRPSERAKGDAGELSGREELLLSWAVPIGGRRERGKFWAYFPTEDATTLSGIANAPWKTNEDRQSLLVGTFNDELLKAFSGLVADSLAELVDVEDPGSFLDLLPARGREADRWADEWMTAYVYLTCARVTSLPDQSGALQRPKDLSMHPPSLPADALELWAASPGKPLDWCHHSVERRDRRSRAERLMEVGGGVVQKVEHWLEALVPKAEPSSSARALTVAAQLFRVGNPEPLRTEAAGAEILLTAGGRLVAPHPSNVFIATGHDSKLSGVEFVDPTVAEDPAGAEALTILGIQKLDAEEELRALLDRSDGRIAWASVWPVVDTLPAEVAVAVFTDLRAMPAVKTAAGDFVDIDQVLLPGEVVFEGEAPDVTIDTRFHAECIGVLRALGAVAAPTPDGGSEAEDWFADYEKWALAEFFRKHPGRRPGARLEKLAFPGPLSPLASLKGEPAARFSALLLEHLSATASWWITVPGSRDAASVVDGPGWWYLRKHGRLMTSCGPWGVGSCVGSGLSRWRPFLPVADVLPDAARHLGLKDRAEDLDSQDWLRAFSRASRRDETSDIAAFYSFAAMHTPRPDRVRCLVKDEWVLVSTDQVVVTTRPAETAAVTRGGLPCLQAPDADAAQTLVSRWGMRSASDSLKRTVFHIPSTVQLPLLDAYPALRRYLPEENRGLELQICSELSEQMVTDAGRVDEPTDFAVHEGVVYATERLSEQDLLVQIGREVGARISLETAAGILERRASQLKRKKLEAARAAEDDPARLLALVGEKTLRTLLPEGLLDSLAETGGPPTPRKVAEMAVAVHGVEVLHELRGDLEQAGVEPPGRWAGSQQAQAFVRDLGFDTGYAGTPGSRRDPYVDIERPPVLPGLHPFQRQIADRMKAVLDGKNERRGLLAMPTGAGKTRVAVQAAVEHVFDRETALILWVAQSDELCEQAVQTWAYVWREIGPRGRPMRISRLWSSNEAEPQREGVHVVVATIQKLSNVIKKSDYDWLSRSEAVVIDEAHGSTEPTYTDLLLWLGNRPTVTRCPLVGLTATPFRGMNQLQTQRLVARYGKFRIDEGVLSNNPYPQLQEMGVLARARHQTLDGVPLSMDAHEVRQFEQLGSVPASVYDRLGADTARNRRIVDSIKALPEDWTVLLFAASVPHAKTIAGLLSSEGIPARPVWGDTDPGARRRYVEDFRRGRLRVLTNYGVFAEGFDAPAVRAVYVTRPTFSPNRYQQMIGRGLRGRLNGGKDECLLVDVADNVELFGLRLAFQDFEYLWKS
jgi:superfamily II DNA or RNA helicase